MEDGYGAATRRAELDSANDDLDKLAAALGNEALADLDRRGLVSAGIHRNVSEITALALGLVDVGLRFDQKAADYELKRLAFDGECDNPFREERERELIEAIERAAWRLMSQIMSSRLYKRLCANCSRLDLEHGVLAIKERAKKLVSVKYAELRADFELRAKMPPMASARDGTPSSNRDQVDARSATGRNAKNETKPKRSTAKGDATAKLIAALTNHHQYGNGVCVNREPIGNNKLARLAEVSTASASALFEKHFGGLANYRTLCMKNPQQLAYKLAILNGDAKKKGLANFGRTPPGDGKSDDDE